jgi:hypothetical protein
MKGEWEGVEMEMEMEMEIKMEKEREKEEEDEGKEKDKEKEKRKEKKLTVMTRFAAACRRSGHILWTKYKSHNKAFLGKTESEENI